MMLPLYSLFQINFQSSESFYYNSYLMTRVIIRNVKVLLFVVTVLKYEAIISTWIDFFKVS